MSGQNVKEAVAEIVSCAVAGKPVGATVFHIPLDGCFLSLYSYELRRGLREEYWVKGLRRGKRYKRQLAMEKRHAEGT